jgi:hypothetical protein
METIPGKHSTDSPHPNQKKSSCTGNIAHGKENTKLEWSGSPVIQVEKYH